MTSGECVISQEFFDTNRNTTTLLLNIPHEIWSLIFEYVPQKDRLCQRLVSKLWCKTVDEYSTLKIVYSSIPPHLLQHVLGLRIRGCEFSGLRSKIEPFTYPLLIREIIFGPCVTAENAKAILTSCLNVETMRFFATEKSDTAFDNSIINHTEYLINLKRLQSIELGILFFGRRNALSISPTFTTLIGNRCLVFPGLSQIIIRCTMTPVEWMEFFHFVKRHKRSLKRLHLHHQCICEANNLSSESDIIGENLVSPFINYLCEVNYTSLVFMKGVNAKCNCGGEFLWSNLLSCQNSIQYLRTDLVPNTIVIKEFLEKNKLHLRSLKLYDISLGIDASINGSVFSNCLKLEELSLHIYSSTVIVMKVRKNSDDNNSSFTKKYPEFYGLQFLPKSLKKLSIKGCDIMSSTLIEMSLSLPGLEKLHLGDPGSPSRMEYGVTLEVLLSFIKNFTSLKKLQINEKFMNLTSDDVAQTTLKETTWGNIKNLLRRLCLIKESQCVEDDSATLAILDASGNSFDALENNSISITLNLFNGKRTELVDQLNAVFKGLVKSGSEDHNAESIQNDKLF